jgi:beta-phosphoglucomutase-like phosphatase (HAD superfamily)
VKTDQERITRSDYRFIEALDLSKACFPPEDVDLLAEHYSLGGARVIGALDHDGTVADSEFVAGNSAWNFTNEILARQNLPPITKAEFLEKCSGRPFEDNIPIIRQMRPGVMFPEDIEALCQEEENRAVENLKKYVEPTSGTQAVLQLLRDIGTDLVLVTTSLLSRIQACFTRTRHDQFFGENVITRDDLGKNASLKPEPLIYNVALERMRADLETDLIFAVEDTAHGVEAAARAGIKHVIGFVGGRHIPVKKRIERAKELTAKGAYDVISDMRYLPALLVELEVLKYSEG